MEKPKKIRKEITPDMVTIAAHSFTVSTSRPYSPEEMEKKIKKYWQERFGEQYQLFIK